MITKNQIKYYSALSKKKFRDTEQRFLVEGTRSVIELLQTDFSIEALIGLPEWFGQCTTSIAKEIATIECTKADIEKISTLQSPPTIIAVVNMPPAKQLPLPEAELILVLDTIQDPGNMGTIIRTADWFGIAHIVCSAETVEQYNPKVVQSTMGALGRVTVHYTDLVAYISAVKTKNLPVYGTLLSGTNMYEEPLTAQGLIVLGNEGNGISPEIESLVDTRLYIPPFPVAADKVESLNVGVAASIVCAEFRRRSS